uniref:RIMS-binding protein 2 n=1 Tax=Knipowitschia caucasica TaxID=637954 RepID=A0AAV2J8R2_KNICA
MCTDGSSSTPTERGTCPCSSLKQHQRNTPHVDWKNPALYQTELSRSDGSLTSQCAETNMENGTDYTSLVHQNSDLLQALDALEKTCTTLREENGLLRKTCAPETEEKVRRLRRKNTELAVLAKRLEDRARKLQEANLRVVNPTLMRPGSVEQCKRAFARQRARDLSQHAAALLNKDKEISALQHVCSQLEAQLGTSMRSTPLCGEFEKLLKESQKEVLRLQRQLSITSFTQPQSDIIPDTAIQCGGSEKGDKEKRVVGEASFVSFDEILSGNEKIPGEEEELGQHLTPVPGLSPTPSLKEEQPEDHLDFLESELCKKRKECENLEHEVKKRQRRCRYLESQLEEEQCKNGKLEEETDLLRRKAQLLYQTQTENEELRNDLSQVTAQHNSVLEENQKLRAKLENLEQVLKHMREVAERRQQLELEHEQALAILKFKQDEIKRLQRAQLFAKREHEGVVQMLESKVRDLEEKCRGQSEQFGLLSQELEKFRMQASMVDLAASALPNNPSLSVLTNGLGLTADHDVAAALRIGLTPHAAGLSRVERSPVTKHRELPTISVSKSPSSSCKSEAARLTPKSDRHLSPHKSSSAHEVDTASEVEELDIDVASGPDHVHRRASKLQVFIARYSYNPYDGPNDNPEVELPLTAGEYIYMYGDMDEDGFYEGELMDGRRGLVPSNFVERVSDDEVFGSHHPETVDITHNSLLDSNLHSASHQHNLHTGVSASQRTELSTASVPAYIPVDSASALTVPAPLTNGLDLDLEEVGVDIVPYPRKLTLIKQLAKSIIIGWDPPLVPAGWGNVLSYNVYVDQELRFSVPFGSQNKAVLERLDINLKTYRVSVQSLTEKGPSDQLRCSLLVGRDVSVAPTQLNIDRVTATTANLSWLPSNSNYVHIVSLNGEEYELVKAGCYSLCLSNLTPSLQYTVKVEARPHRTPWELPVERREHRVSMVIFKTLMAGPPDAPLDVQLEHGPSPGIALISWLPVTIDAAGSSNGVRVTGYSVYVDKRKVLEVSSPTAGSVLLGPSQIHSLQGAQELTVRSMSAHGESCDSLPVNLPFKLEALLTGPSVTPPVVPPPSCIAGSPCRLPSPAFFGNSSANMSMLPGTMLPNTQATTHVVEPFANQPNALPPDDPCSIYVKAWANPSSAAALAVCDSVLPAASNIPSMVSVTSAITTMPTQQANQPAAVHSRDTDSPGLIRPFPSITEFIEDPCAKLEPIPTPSKATPIDLFPKDTRLLRPPSTSPLDSEVEEEHENTRLVSIEEFLRQDPESTNNLRQKTYGKGLVELSPSDYHGDNSRSDLSDILEEEEEDLSTDHLEETQTMGYKVAANRLKFCQPGTPDSDEEVLERILKLPTQFNHGKQLSSIPEASEEDSSRSEKSILHHTQPRARPRDPRDHRQQQHGPPQHQQPSSHGQTKESLFRHEGPQVRLKTRHRVHYADPVDSCYTEEDISMYQTLRSRGQSARCPPQPNPQGRALLKGLGDRLRREAMLRSQMAASSTNTVAHGSGLTKPNPISKSVHTVRAPMSRAAEIDVDYGTDTEEPVECGRGEVVMEQMSSEWWVEEAQQCKPRRHCGSRPPSLGNVTARQQQWEINQDQGGLCKSIPMHNRLPKGFVEPPKMRCNLRLFVALFSYDPASMSPNPGAIEEELPFTEGQIIQVIGDKDADGFYHGECDGRVGLVPCNMVTEIQVEDEATKQHLLKQGALSTVGSIDKGTCIHAQLLRRVVPPSKPRRSKKVEVAAMGDTSQETKKNAPVAEDQGVSAVGGAPLPNPGRKMVAIFDYDPRESSPNTDVEAELTFSAGDIIHVIGDMDEDGFFLGELNGQRGLVPSNYLQALLESSATPPEPRRESQADHICQQHMSPAPEETLCPDVEAVCPEHVTQPAWALELAPRAEPVSEVPCELRVTRWASARQRDEATSSSLPVRSLAPSLQPTVHSSIK